MREMGSQRTRKRQHKQAQSENTEPCKRHTGNTRPMNAILLFPSIEIFFLLRPPLLSPGSPTSALPGASTYPFALPEVSTIEIPIRITHSSFPLLCFGLLEILPILLPFYESWIARLPHHSEVVFVSFPVFLSVRQTIMYGD